MHSKEEKRLSASVSNIKASLNDQLIDNIHVFQRNVHFLYPYFFILSGHINLKQVNIPRCFQTRWQNNTEKILHSCMEIRNFSSHVEKIFHEWAQRTSEIFSTLTEKFHISKQPHNVVLIYYINTNEIPNHFTYNKQFFGVKGRIYYVAIATVIFSHVKISSFRAKAPLLFHWCLYNNLSFYLWK